MNILFVSAVLPYPLHSGGQIRIYNLLRRLGKRHRITLASFIRSDEERQFQEKLDFCSDVHMVMRGRAWQPTYYAKAVFGKYPFLMATYDNPKMRELIRSLLEKQSFDLVHLEPFYVWPSVPKTALPIVVSEHNIEYDVYQGFTPRFARLDTSKLAFWEHYVWKKASWVTAVSEDDASVIRNERKDSVTVVPNGVDTRIFRYRKPVITDHPTLLFVGNFRWYPNREAAKRLVTRIWPQVKKVLPGAKLWIVGRDMPREFQRFSKDADDIASVYREADILVAPHGVAGGTKFKMLEAMSTGLPIVTTHEGVSGLAMEENVHYVTDIMKLWDNASLALELAKNGRILVEEKYSWERIAQKLDYVWKNA